MLNNIFAFALAALLIFTLGHASYEDAKEEQDMYCKMVSEKTWPDYNQNFERICK
jgi:hypothetical protein